MFEDATELYDDTPLLSGIMDSLALMQLVAFLEEEFDVEIDDADMTADHFRTIADIEALVQGPRPAVSMKTAPSIPSSGSSPEQSEFYERSSGSPAASPGMPGRRPPSRVLPGAGIGAGSSG